MPEAKKRVIFLEEFFSTVQGFFNPIKVRLTSKINDYCNFLRKKPEPFTEFLVYVTTLSREE